MEERIAALQEQGIMTRGFVPRQIGKVAVLGFGTMGRGLVIEIVRNMDVPVIVKDIPEALEPGKAFVRKILEGLAEKKPLRASVDVLMQQIVTTSEYGPAFKDVDLVIEAVFEELSVKNQVYTDLVKAVPETCLIASNTSSIHIADMAGFVDKPERFGGLHFFSPVWLMQLVEVIQGEATSRDTVDNLLAFTAAIRKRPIVCRDNAGFVVNALLFPVLLGAFQCLEEGNTIEKIDKAMVDFGMPVGPIRLTDEVGIDVLHKIFKGMAIPQDTIGNLVGDGRFGLKKSGKGIFIKGGGIDPEALALVAQKTRRELSPEQIQNELLEGMVKTGKDLLDRRIVDNVQMIDTGMIFGIGFPAAKGGPMRWADTTGLSNKLFGKTFYA